MIDYAKLNFAYGAPAAEADFRCEMDDFVVEEILGFAPSGEGEHLCLQIEKRGENTHWVAENIARQLAVKPLDVSYCGKKDRFAVTTQWFSVYLPKRQVAPTLLHQLGSQNPDGSQASTKLMDYARHSKKLRRGDHQGNRFHIRLRNISPQYCRDIDQRLATLREQGVPNYFGEQRFGRHGNNLKTFDDALVQKKIPLRRQQKSMVLSAARSYLFNLVLSVRVNDGSWQSAQTGPLWGRGELKCTEMEKQYELNALASWRPWCEALEHVGLFQERRSLRLSPQLLTWQWLGQDLQVAFTLPAGEFATALLREISRLNVKSAAG